ncbi:phage major tail protein, TP901-1 family [Virgibacillus sp. Bac332]|uniref:phage major tail protein, TP901-1 family n=1 Tax=Virgibacillus sp. Bac332 TaxID=2419842 RepID=UPI000EF4955D|nr:phage major tail protein, TP901-1 family [Virgibacillus sp. Bac332]
MINGRETVLMVQPVDNTIGDPGMIIANLTENSWSIENELIDEFTKMGRILAYGQNSESFEMSAYGERNDPGQTAILDAIEEKKEIKVWEVDTIANEQGTYDARFAYCLVESAEKSNADSFQEVTATLQVRGKSQKGVLTTIPAQLTEPPYPFEEPGETGQSA